MKTIMKKLITIKIIPVLALVLLVVLVSSFVKGTAQDLEPGPVYLADETVTDSIVKKLQGTITLYVTEEMVDVEADIAAINELGNQYGLACNTGDIELYMSLWDDNGVQMPPDEPAVIGKEQIRARMGTLFNLFFMEMLSLTTEEVQVAGDWAFTRATYMLSLTPKAGGEPILVDGKDLNISKRQADGTWKIYIDCFNNNVPPTQ